MKLTALHYKSKSWITSLFIGVILAVSGCKDSVQKTSFDTAGCAVPIDYIYKNIDAQTPYQQWQVRMTKNGITWNGIDVTEQELTKFAQQLAQIPQDSGSATFQVVGLSCQERMRVRKALSRSSLCSKGRCWEANEIVKAPVVH